MTTKIILASKSPRRIALLKKLGLKFQTYAPKYSEETIYITPKAAVLAHARAKAREAATKHPNAIIMAFDTLGVQKGRMLQKPKSKKQAFEMLSRLNNSTHEVLTGIYLLNSKNGKALEAVEKTKIKFAKMTNCQLHDYIDSGEGLDKAAAYAIQGLGALMVEKIEGDYFNVVGLPLCKLGKMLREMHVNLLAKR